VDKKLGRRYSARLTVNAINGAGNLPLDFRRVPNLGIMTSLTRLAL